MKTQKGKDLNFAKFSQNSRAQKFKISPYFHLHRPTVPLTILPESSPEESIPRRPLFNTGDDLLLHNVSDYSAPYKINK
jgi:hypothetical protein